MENDRRESEYGKKAHTHTNRERRERERESGRERDRETMKAHLSIHSKE